MKITLRPLRDDDAFTSVKWRNDPRIWAFTGSAPDREITIEDELAWIRRVSVDPSSQRFAILADEEYVGNIYLTDIRDGVADYHVFIGEAAWWGKGIARSASEQIIEYGRSALALRAIALKVHARNRAALSLYRSLGFLVEGEEGAFVRMRLHLGTQSGCPNDT